MSDKSKQKKPAVTKQPRQTEKSSDLIKPKYVEDKSVYYKKSTYLSDLLKEG